MQQQPTFSDVQLLKFVENPGNRTLGCSKQTEKPVNLQFKDKVLSLYSADDNQEFSRLPLASLTSCLLTEKSVALRPNVADCNSSSLILQFSCTADAAAFRNKLSEMQKMIAPEDKKLKSSMFDERTDEASASQYFQFYGYLSQQQNMLQDYVRTATYQRAILSNFGDFKDKVILDVGAGSGILSFFAVQAGAARVYAVEASSMAIHCENLVKANGCADKIKVVAGKIEEVCLPEQVDVIVSEPMGYMLLNERMLETFLHARKFLKPGGKMYPTRGDLHVAPFTDEALYLEQTAKANFWCQDSFHGVNLSYLRPQALKEYFRQPVVDTWHVGILTGRSVVWSVDFAETSEKTLQDIHIGLNFSLHQTAHIHGLAFWFDVAFIGCSQTVWLSTSPTESLTHWYQVRCLFERPILGKAGQICTGKLHLKANERQSYDVTMEVCVDGRRASNSLDLKNPYFRYGGQVAQPPPGAAAGPTPNDTYWNYVTQNSPPPPPTTHQQSGGEHSGLSGPISPGLAALSNGSLSINRGLNSNGNAPNLMDLLFATQATSLAYGSGGSPTSSRAPGTTPITQSSNQGIVTSLPLKMYTSQQQQQQSLPFSSPAYPMMGSHSSPETPFGLPPASSTSLSFFSGN